MRRTFDEPSHERICIAPPKADNAPKHHPRRAAGPTVGNTFEHNDMHTLLYLASKLVPVNHPRQGPRLLGVEGREDVDVVVEKHVVIVSQNDKPFLGRVGLQHKPEADERLAERAEVVVLFDAGICDRPLASIACSVTSSATVVKRADLLSPPVKFATTC